MELRPYQVDAATAVCQQWQRTDRTLISMPTGSGKSVVLAQLAACWDKELAACYKLPERVLWLAHRDELIDQACEHIKLATGEYPAVEKGERSVFKSHEEYSKRVVVSSIQTLMQDSRRENFGRGEFGMVIADEAHHAVCESWEKVLNYFQGKLVGATATTDRTDEVSLGKLFQSVAYHYELLDAIKDGWLCPIRQQFVAVKGLDWSKVSLNARGDLSASDLEVVIGEEEAIHSIVAPVAQMAGDRQTIIFTPSVASAEAVASLLPRYTSGGAKAVSGATPEEERRHIIGQFKGGEIQYLSNCALLTEGFDAPKTSCIVIARPTKSRLLYSQLLGRGLRGGRLCPVEGKTDCLVIDLAGVSKKHKLVHAADLLGGKYHTAVVEHAVGRIEEQANQDTPVDVLAELLEAQANAEELKRQQRTGVIAEAKLKRKTIDPFVIMADAVDLEDTRTPGWWQDTPADAEQVAYLEKHGIKAEGSLTYADARRLKAELTRRQREGLCSFKQARMLKIRGLDPCMGFEEAKDLMAYFSSRPDRWKFNRDDAIRVARAKKRGKQFSYSDLVWRFTVSPNVACDVRKVGQEAWQSHKTNRKKTFEKVHSRGDGCLVFRSGGWELRIGDGHVKRRVERVK